MQSAVCSPSLYRRSLRKSMQIETGQHNHLWVAFYRHTIRLTRKKTIKLHLYMDEHAAVFTVTGGPLVSFGLRIVLPDAVVEAGGQAQPGQVGGHEQRGRPADGVPGQHGGAHCPGENQNLVQRLELKAKKVWMTQV